MTSFLFAFALRLDGQINLNCQFIWQFHWWKNASYIFLLGWIKLFYIGCVEQCCIFLCCVLPPIITLYILCPFRLRKIWNIFLWGWMRFVDVGQCWLMLGGIGSLRRYLRLVSYSYCDWKFYVGQYKLTKSFKNFNIWLIMFF